MNSPVSPADWAEHRRQAMNAMPEALAGKPIGDVLLPYQAELLRATAANQLVVTDKSRRIGMTWGVGADAVLTSGAAKDAGGMDTLYLGYNLDMAREFIDVCAMWSRAFERGASAVEEFLFTEADGKGETRSIGAFRIKFASGFEIVALSSRPRSLRGRQGFVILDEFAFHDDAAELLKAAMALLIWGGKVLAISTHNGVDNPFNQLIEEIRAKRRPGAIVRCTFDDALDQGLYQRICLVTGKTWSAEAEAEWRAAIRAFYGDDAAEELDCIPAQGSGVFLTGGLIEACMTHAAPVLRLTCPDGFELKSDAERHDFVDAWLEERVAPLLAKLDPNLRHSYGFDFGRTGDLSVFLPLAEERTLLLAAPFILELRNVPFRQQEQLLFFVADRLPRFGSGKHDARGNGQYLAEVAAQRYGATRIEQVMLSQAYYLEHMPVLKAAFEDRSIVLPMDADAKSDLRQIRTVRGIPMVPAEAHTRGTDGGQRHGDVAIAAMLAVAAAKADAIEYGYRPVAQRDGGRGDPGSGSGAGFMLPDHDGDDRARDAWRPPLGAGLRGSL